MTGFFASMHPVLVIAVLFAAVWVGHHITACFIVPYVRNKYRTYKWLFQLRSRMVP
jgi:hypothetical protein